MNLDFLKDKKIAIVGFGVEGRAMARFLSAHNFPFDVLDMNATIDMEMPNIQTSLGPEYLKVLKNYDVIFRSPGVKLSDIQKNAKEGAIITSQIKLFFDNCPAKIIGVTGTKGKGTTAKLIYDIMIAAGIKTHLAGNFGPDAINMIGEIKPDDYVVLELSSFQLQDLEKSPHISVVLMVTSEHLDHHKDEKEYVQAKSSILKYQGKDDIAVINQDYPNSMAIGKLGAAKKYFVQTLWDDVKVADPFEVYDPKKYIDTKDGVFAEQIHGNIYLIESSHERLFLNTKELILRGFHNVQNVAAAICVAKALGIKEEIILDTIRNFKGLEHRLEFVAEKNGVKFYNDSIGTTPESCIAAMKAFTDPEIVIIGGFDKKGDYSGLASEICKQKNIKAVVLIGQIGEQLKELLEKNEFSGEILFGAKSMAGAFDQIKHIVQEGDVVLLAPATSSFDMFENYKDRGNQFKAEVEAYGQA